VRPYRISYLLLAMILSVALVVGARGDGGPPTTKDRVDRIAQEVRCPTCEGLSAAESDAPSSQAIRQEIQRRVDAGQSDDQIRAFLVSRYGKDIILRPESRGVSALVWALPASAVVVAAAGLVFAFRRWRSRPSSPPSAEDRELVDQALHR
jgi:cytochrome c-type biogenesis protein CcmH